MLVSKFVRMLKKALVNFDACGKKLVLVDAIRIK
jgi:hypothetical protein